MMPYQTNKSLVRQKIPILKQRMEENFDLESVFNKKKFINSKFIL